MKEKNITPCQVNVSSETGRLRAVLLHRPGVEIERMTPLNAAHCLYSDILNKVSVDQEYRNFCGVLERWTNVYYVEDILEELLRRDDIKTDLVRESVFHYGRRPVKQAGTTGDRLFETLMEMDSMIYNRVLINSMSFEVRERETLIYEAIFRHFFGVELLNATQWNNKARTEGGDVHIASPDLLCVGEGIRTNAKGIEYLAQTFARERDHFNILVQELPHDPESFIHLDMVFTFLGSHQCMAFEPMLKKNGLFSDKDTTLISIDNGKISYRQVPNILKGLEQLGWDIDPVIGGGSDPWVQLREQWHSGANFFSIGDGKVIGYRRNVHTIEALDHAGFAVLNSEDILSGKVSMDDYEKFVATFPGAELPRAGGGARCMTMPILRD